MKGYTSLSQSKRLAEILPIESADMGWELDKNCSIEAYNLIPLIRYSTEERKELFEKDKELIPCWSLAALVELIRNFQPNYQSALFVGKENGYQYMSGMDSTTYEYNNPVDACYEMILKLHEQKLL